MKTHLVELLAEALVRLREAGVLSADYRDQIAVERVREKSHGDFACNIAMRLAKEARRKPRELAEQIVAQLPHSERVASVEIAVPGFINFTLSARASLVVVADILAKGREYGRSKLGAGRRVQVEFVSANPNGPLHVGHGRGAAYGSVLASVLAEVGYAVDREYYVNDAGRQMDILCVSVWFRYLELTGEHVTFPVNGYKGAYVRAIAANLREKHGDEFRRPIAEIMQGVPADEPEGDKDAHVDGIIVQAKKLLGKTSYRVVFGAGLHAMREDIREDLAEFGVNYDEWFSELSLTESGAVQRAIERLQASGHMYEKDGAQWFRSTDFGDEKDRVVVRENGQGTYFASDIAYHMNKYERGYDRVIDVWGSDHHGYVPRVKAAIKAMGYNPDKLEVMLVQFAILYKGGERMQMSTRSGEFVTLRELRGEVGNDAARFFYVMRKCEQHLDFDLDLATSKSSENPVYYIQYAHARICSVFRELKEKGFVHDVMRGEANLARLTVEHETAMLATLARYPEVVEAAAVNFEPHQIPHYLRELANDFHTYYNSHKFLVEDEGLRDARLNLIAATRQVLHNGLQVLGVSAPEAM